MSQIQTANQALRNEIGGFVTTETGMKNRIINGDMRIAQRGTSATVSDLSNEGYSTIDRWFINFNNTIGGAVTFSQSSDAPTGFATSAKIQCSTTNTSLSTNQYVAILQRIEAFELQSLGYGTVDAQPITVSWYMKTESYTGPISVALFTADGTPEHFTVSVTPTAAWARYSVTIPGSATATINNDNGLGMTLQFVVSGDTGSSIAAASDSTAWSTTRSDYRNNVGNILSSASNAFYITGVQLEAGSVATPFERRQFGQELALCQRYFEVYPMIWAGASAATIWQHGQYSVEKRATPTVTRIGNHPDTGTAGFSQLFPNIHSCLFAAGSVTSRAGTYTISAEL